MILKVVIAGIGGISEQHLKGLIRMDFVKITGLVDLDPIKAEKAAKDYNAVAYTSLDEALPYADIVYVLTPPKSHKGLVMKALAAGKHVIVEKPISDSLDDAREMQALARKKNRQLIVAFNMRYKKGFELLKDFTFSDQVGDLKSLWCHRIGWGICEEENWRTTEGQICGMTIESLSHDIDFFHLLAGEIADIFASTSSSRPDLPGFDDMSTSVCNFKSGVTGLIQACWSSHLNMSHRGVIGTKGTAYISGPGIWTQSEFHWKTEGMENEQVELLYDPLDETSYYKENLHYLETLAAGKRVVPNGEDGIKALEVSHALLRSSSENKVVTL